MDADSDGIIWGGYDAPPRRYKPKKRRLCEYKAMGLTESPWIKGRAQKYSRGQDRAAAKIARAAISDAGPTSIVGIDSGILTDVAGELRRRYSPYALDNIDGMDDDDIEPSRCRRNVAPQVENTYSKRGIENRTI